MQPNHTATPSVSDDLVLTELPNGEHAWLRAEAPRFVLTDAGRRALATAELFGTAPDDEEVTS